MTRKELIKQLQSLGTDGSKVCDTYDDFTYDINNVTYDEKTDTIKINVDD